MAAYQFMGLQYVPCRLHVDGPLAVCRSMQFRFPLSVSAVRFPPTVKPLTRTALFVKQFARARELVIASFPLRDFSGNPISLPAAVSYYREKRVLSSTKKSLIKHC